MSAALWRPFEVEFGTFQKTLRTQSEEVRQEVALSSEKAAAHERELQIIERSSASRYRMCGDAYGREEQIWRQQYLECKSSKRCKKIHLPLQSNNTLSSGTKRERLLSSLSTYNHMAPFKQARKARHGSTTAWLSDTQEFQDWLNEAESSLFWCSGIRKSKREISTRSFVLTIEPT